jgi:hypothetical protein
MTRTEVVCLHCRGRIRWHWELMFLHARCKSPLVEQVVKAIPAPPGQEGAASMRWCKGCQQYHLGPHPQLGRHLRRAVAKMLRE